MFYPNEFFDFDYACKAYIDGVVTEHTAGNVNVLVGNGEDQTNFLLYGLPIPPYMDLLV